MPTLEAGLLENVVDSLPEAFDFYGTGMIELEPPDAHGSESARLDVLEALREGATAVSFDLIDWRTRAKMILVFDERLDESQYAEAGNVIASRLVWALKAGGTGEWMISPPRRIAPDLLGIYLERRPSAVRTYLHRAGEALIRLHCVLLLDDEREFRDV